MTAARASSHPLTPFTPIVMAKYPVPGAVKSRLTESGELSADIAAEIARAMLKCTIGRLVDAAMDFGLPTVLAVTPDHAGPDLLAELGLHNDGQEVHLQPQGDGDLGERMLRQWNRLSGGAVAFFGGDTPDLPVAHLRGLAAALTDHPLAIGPTDDGGYWTLAGHEPSSELLSGIGWGTDSVFQETMDKAKRENGDIAVLPRWHDVDYPRDVVALVRRIDSKIQKHAADRPLIQLRYDLHRVLSDTPLAAEIRSTV